MSFQSLSVLPRYSWQLMNGTQEEPNPKEPNTRTEWLRVVVVVVSVRGNRGVLVLLWIHFNITHGY